MTHDAHKRHRMHIKKCGSIKLQMYEDTGICTSLSLIGAAGSAVWPHREHKASDFGGFFCWRKAMDVFELSQTYKETSRKADKKACEIRSQIDSGQLIGEDLLRARRRAHIFRDIAIECRITADKLEHYYDHSNDTGHEHLAGDF